MPCHTLAIIEFTVLIIFYNLQTDIIVNTVKDDLDLDNGAVSYAILYAAGPSIQQEVKDNAPNGLQAGEMVSSSGGNMKCKHIYHAHLCSWDGGKGRAQQVILLFTFYILFLSFLCSCASI